MGQNHFINTKFTKHNMEIADSSYACHAPSLYMLFGLLMGSAMILCINPFDLGSLSIVASDNEVLSEHRQGVKRAINHGTLPSFLPLHTMLTSAITPKLRLIQWKQDIKLQFYLILSRRHRQ